MFGRRKDSDFRNEIEAHIRLEADQLIGEGVPELEAEAAARRTFGNVPHAQEAFHDSRQPLWWDHFTRDVLHGACSLRKAPGLTVASVLTIALGIGATTAVFSLVDTVLLKSLPVSRPNELVFLDVAGSAGGNGPPPYP